MPSWQGNLEPGEIWDVVAYIQTLSETFDQDIDTSKIVTYPEEPGYNQSSIQKGKKLFARLGCQSCHGKNGTGNGPGAKGLTDYKGRPISPRNYRTEPFKSGGRSRDIYRTIHNGLGGTPMAPYGTAVDDQKLWHLVHYVESLRSQKGLIEYLFSDEIGRELLFDYREEPNEKSE
jgi:mono/diheme cytochrome c family protein